jgi:hypothetical protein
MVRTPFEWMHAPAGWVPGVAKFVGEPVRNEVVAISVEGLRVFPNGFQFSFLVRSEPLPSELCASSLAKARSLRRDPDELYLRIGVEFSDGRRSSAGVEWVCVRPDSSRGSDLPSNHPPDARRDILLKVGGSESDERTFSGVGWVWPLPPPGSLTFWLGWAAAELDLQPVSADSWVVREAAERSFRIRSEN